MIQIIFCFLILSAASITGCSAFKADGFPSNHGGEISREGKDLMPKDAHDAVLTNLRQLTFTGMVLEGPETMTWMPDGQGLVYTEIVPSPSDKPGRPPKMELWKIDADGKNPRVITEGSAPQISPDGKTMYFRRHQSGIWGLWAMDLNSQKIRQISSSYLHFHFLADSRVVISEHGTYAPLHIFDPETGGLTALMKTHPGNAPKRARLSPDGTQMVYPDGTAVYLAEANGSHPVPLADTECSWGEAWWAPNGKHIIYSTCNYQEGRLIRSDRYGNNRTTLTPKFGDSGYVRALRWAPDSNWVLAVTSLYTPERSRLYLMDAAGNMALLMEAHIQDAVWSPDGHSVALVLWEGPQGEVNTSNVWLVDLRRKDGEASRRSVAPPMARNYPIPDSAYPSSNLSPEEVISRFWEAIAEKNHLVAWAAQSTVSRTRQGYAQFRSSWQCVTGVKIHKISCGKRAGNCSFNVDLEQRPECHNPLYEKPGPFAILVKESPDGPWLIEGFGSGP